MSSPALLKSSGPRLPSTDARSRADSGPCYLGAVHDDVETERQIGWHADPFGRFEQRWWDGAAWTEKIRTGRTAGIDPPGIEVAPVAISEPEPARPIEDALLPIQRPRIADKLALFVGWIVFLALIAVFVVAVTA